MPTRYEGPERERRALDTFIKLNRATETVGSRLHRWLAVHGMTLAQLAVLEALLHLGPMSHGDLARKLLRSNPNMTAVIDKLESTGLVRRDRSAQDRRLIEVSLTDLGRERIAGIFPEHARRIATLFASLSPEEQAELGRLCKKLGLAAAGGELPEPCGQGGAEA